MNDEFPATASAKPTLTPSASVERWSPGTLLGYFFELAEKALNTVDPIPPASTSTCVSGEAQRNHPEPAGSPYLADWSMDTRPTYKLSDAEVIDKGHWQLESLRKREVLKRAMEVPTVYPEVK
jgi:hypothetical protein